jgi:hypothetical protein
MGEVSLALNQPLDGGSPCVLALPGSLLEEIESSRDGLAEIVVDAGSAVCRWTGRGTPRESTWTPLDASPPDLPMPRTFKAVDPSILQALHECGRCAARDSVRFALIRLQISGQAGQIVGTDGQQLLVWKGFDFPFTDAALVPAIPVFANRDLTIADEVRIGMSENHIVLTAGPWTVWLGLDKTGRFPDIVRVIPQSEEHILRLDPEDARRGVEFCRLAVKTPEESATVTIQFGRPPSMRIKKGADASASELILPRSTCEGKPTMIVFNRDHLLKALSLGLLRVNAPSVNGPVVFRDDTRTYVTTTLIVERAIPPLRAAAALQQHPAPNIIPISQGVPVMATDTNGRNQPSDPALDSLDFMAEAEALRDALGEVGRRAGRLVNSLKQLQKQRRVLETAWSSLKNLRLGS